MQDMASPEPLAAAPAPVPAPVPEQMPEQVPEQMNASAAAPEPPEVAIDALSASEAARQTAGGADFYSLGELLLTLVILFFGLIAVGVFYAMLRTNKGTPYNLRMFVIIILIFGTLLIVSSAYTTEQIAPVVGFFGTIAGYLLGRSDRRTDDTL